VGGVEGVKPLVEEAKEVARILRLRTKIDPLNKGKLTKVAPII
jgi:hypothetical protein